MAASVLRYWKESASLIIVRRLQPTQCLREVVVPRQKTAVEATTRQPQPNYQLFMAERTSRMSSFPNAHVFPGGSTEDSDFSAQWLDVLSASPRKPGQEQTPEGQLVDFFAGNRSNTTNNGSNNGKTPIYRRKRLPEFSAIPSEVAFRITAIREVFEEIGLLFARKAEENKTDDDEKEESLIRCYQDTNKQRPFGRRCKPKICHLPLEMSLFWRQRIVENSENFLHMCKELKLIPDITALSEWANWLTPTHVTGKRFDTMFYITLLDEHQQPEVNLDSVEFLNYHWSSPIEFLSEAMSKKINMSPPQIWELNHLNFSSWEELYGLVASNPYLQPKRYIPVKAKCKDGYLFLLPGDHMYPENPSTENYVELSLPFTKNEIHSANKYMNHFDVEARKIYRTVPLSPPRSKPPFTSHL